jgi:EmrB/QacA subfamily drug resistance transporter
MIPAANLICMSLASRGPQLLVGSLLVATFMGFLDLFVVVVGLPNIRADLGASFATSQLVVGIYVIAYGVSLVLGGRLGDRFGRRRLLVGGMAAFTASSALCAAAPTATALVLARCLQGLSAAAMLPQVLSIIQVAVPVNRRTAAIGAYGAVIGAASVAGQVLGGVLVQADVFGLGWRALFAINLPIGIAGLLLMRAVVPESSSPSRGRLDLAGAAALSIALLAILLALVEGPDRGWPAWTWATLVVGALFCGVTAIVERRVERRGAAPLLPPALLRRRAVRIGLALILAFYASNTGFFVVLTFFLQDGLHATPLAAGLTFAPLGVAFSVASLLGRRPGARQDARTMVAGAAAMVAGLAAAILVSRAGGGPVALTLPLAILGAGQGMVAPPLIGTILARVPAEDAGAASGMLLTATQVANALGVAIVGGTFSAVAAHGPDTAFTASGLVALALAVLTGGAAETLRRPRASPTAYEAACV